MKNKFITIEGIEGVGKSTSVKFLQRYLQQKEIDFISTREPGGTEIAEHIRSVLLSHHEEIMHADTELLLMFAGRAQHLNTVIKPAIAAGKWVVCDRFTDASYAYQGGGRQIATERIATLEQWVQGELRPDVTILLTAPVKIALARAKGRGEPDRIEREQEEFFTRVQEAYLKRAALFPERYHLIDASRTPKFVREQLKRVLDTIL